MDKLTTKQKAFVAHYLENGFNATQAARSAGYAEKSIRSIASENLTKQNILAEIDRYLEASAMQSIEALYRLSEHARGDLGEFIGLSEHEIKKHPKSWLIKKYKITTTSKKDFETERIEIELHDPQSALVNLIKQNRLNEGLPTQIIASLPALMQLIDLLQKNDMQPSEVFNRMIMKLANGEDE